MKKTIQILILVSLQTPLVWARSTNSGLTRICQSENPVLVVDHFVEQGEVAPYIDIDGDDLPDVAHGELVSAFLKSSGMKVLPVNLKKDSSLRNIEQELRTVLMKVRVGELKVSAINLSQIVDVTIAGVDEGSPTKITAQNLAIYKKRIFNRLRTKMNETGSMEFGTLSEVFEEFRKLGIPVFTAAGNSGPKSFNVLGLMPGVVSVGALNLKSMKMPTSSDNSLISIWRRGEYVFRKTADGRIDLNHDNKDDFIGVSLTGKKTLAETYSGQALNDVLQELPQGELMDLLNRRSPEGIRILKEHMVDGLYRVEDLLKFFKIEDGAFAQALRLRGDYFDKDMKIGFIADDQERVVFDPAGDGDPRQVILISGTSFAAPSICDTHK